MTSHHISIGFLILVAVYIHIYNDAVSDRNFGTEMIN